CAREDGDTITILVVDIKPLGRSLDVW
nr:immunoglobulin heavy chain junction region [Macaca mulatta]MOV42510.1 immunoglobulin heavy chain junction region [Macaca mulatta]